VDAALDALEAALTTTPRADHRHRLEHVGNLRCGSEQIHRMARLGIVAVPNATFLHARAKHTEPLLGAVRGRDPANLRDLVAGGGPVVLASDWPGLYPGNPLRTIQACVLRQSLDGSIIAPDQAIDVHTALRLYTAGGAWLGFEERDKGSLEPGKLADLVVLSKDPLRVPPEELGSIRVEMTLVGGNVAHALEPEDAVAGHAAGAR
jgi:predicted amidohydrolase YtcJ